MGGDTIQSEVNTTQRWGELLLESHAPALEDHRRAVLVSEIQQALYRIFQPYTRTDRGSP